MEGSRSGSVKIMTDLDLGGPQTNGSYGSGSTTPILTIWNLRDAAKAPVIKIHRLDFKFPIPLHSYANNSLFVLR
jgi:hypothetical protein